MVKKYQDGEVMDLVWPDMQDMDEAYVRGHIDESKAYVLLCEFYPEYNFFTPTRHYGRWSMEAGDDGPQHTLRVYLNPGKGRFPIMVASCVRKKEEVPEKKERWSLPALFRNILTGR